MILFNFNTQSNISNWSTVNDVVMGGRSNSSFKLSDEGFGVFEGHVSLENNGGFSMVRYRFESQEVGAFTKVCIRLKGDGKSYQFRIKTNKNDDHAYIGLFNTTKSWTNIEIPFKVMYPAFRGRKLDIGNYTGERMEEIAFLIGNKKEESFKLEIDTIELK